MYKLTVPGVNFTNILRTAFLRKDPNNAKINTDDLTVFFALLGYLFVQKLRFKRWVRLTTFNEVLLPQYNYIYIYKLLSQTVTKEKLCKTQKKTRVKC
jgi:hypothetical protein